MNILFVVSHPHDWPFRIAGATTVPARLYLTDARYADATDCKVFNLCRTTAYQSRGYYVSMLAEARGHLPVPDVRALEELRATDPTAPVQAELDETIQSALAHVEADRFELDACFGRHPDGRLLALCEQLFNRLRIPLLRAVFERPPGRREQDRRWRLCALSALAPGDLSADTLREAARAATDCTAAHRMRLREPAAGRPAVAILRDPASAVPPSNPEAIRHFQEAAEELGMRSEVIAPDQLDRLREFDALFIRDTTNVDHYTFRAAYEAAQAGLVVMDDPDSILRCNNKIYMTELLARHGLPMPRTMTVHRDNLDAVIPALGLPVVLKQPDGAFSVGVEKIESPQQLADTARELFARSELLLAQEYLPTEFDWRIGILDGKPLFACRYHMVPGHWQIMRHDEEGGTPSEGLSEAVELGTVPAHVLDTALRAAALIGAGFYGVDLKQRGSQCYVIEINDNPNVDAGNEDGVLHQELYRGVMRVLQQRIEARKGGTT